MTPHERGFYPFARAAENIVVAADELAKRVAAEPEARPAIARRVEDAENAGDEPTHQIMVKPNKVFVTPFDREDIYRLASSLDDVCDAIEEAADRIVWTAGRPGRPAGSGTPRPSRRPRRRSGTACRTRRRRWA